MDKKNQELLEKKLELLQDLVQPIPYTIVSKVRVDNLSDVINFFYYDKCESVEIPGTIDMYYDTIVKEQKYDFFLNEQGKQELLNYEELRKNSSANYSISSWIKVLMLFSYKKANPPLRLLSCHQAQMLDLLPVYFSKVDIFKIFCQYRVIGEYIIGVSTEILLQEYYDYVIRSFTLKDIVRKYMAYLERVSRQSSLGDVDYKHFTTDFYYKSLSQMEQYDYVLSQFEYIALPSDGLGLASCLCVLNDKEYRSWEPNNIGYMARRLGIINESKPVYDKVYAYVYFFCAQYYSLPEFLGQRFLVWDVTHMKKPGFKKSLVCSTNIMSFSVRKFEQRRMNKHMIIYNYYPLDNMTSQLLSKLDFEESKNPLEAQYIVATSIVGLEIALYQGLYTEKYWEDYYAQIRTKHLACLNTHNHDVKQKLPNGCSYFDRIYEKLQVSVEQIISIMKEKTLLFTERTFPFRVKQTKLKLVRYKEDGFFRDYGPGSYFIENVMYRGSDKIGHFIMGEYDYIDGKFVVPHVRPEIIKFIKLKAQHVPMFNKTIVKVFLLSTYFSVKYQKYYALYVDEKEARPIVPTISII